MIQLRKSGIFIWWLTSLLIVPAAANAQGVGDLDPATIEKARICRDLGETWLWNNFRDKGLFVYRFNPLTGERPDRNNAIRQLMASIILARRSHQDPRLLELHRRNLRFIHDHWYSEDAFGGYILYDNKSKLGANALYLRCLLASPDFERHRDKARKVLSGILAIQSLDGSFFPWYQEPGYAYDRDRLLTFYSGEALLALAEYAGQTGDSGAATAARLSAAFYLRRYVDEMDRNYYPAYVPWHTMAYARLHELSPDPRYVNAIFAMNDRLLELLDRNDVVGRFYNPFTPEYGSPHASSDGVYLEGLATAYRIARESADEKRARSYGEAIRISVDYISQLQFSAIDPAFHKSPPSAYIGGVPRRHDSPWIRVDTVQHAVDAMDAVLKAGNQPASSD